MPEPGGSRNQAPALVNYNLFESDLALRAGVDRECAAWAAPRLTDFGGFLGSDETIEWGFQANENPPVLRTHDRFGNRIDEIKFHPAWHHLMRASIERGLHNLPWGQEREGAHVARAALMFLASQNEQGHTCPISMTYSCIPALRKNPELAAVWEARLQACHYDPSFRPASEKSGVLIGMAMTEKQGGSDVRANVTRADPDGSSGEYRISGHKWFCSAPMSDAFLVLAQAPGGLSCFLLPRWTPAGERNGFHIQRLKSKLGNRSNASSEVELDRSWASRIGEEGRGIATIIEMVQHTRLDCVIGSAALMRQAVTQAVHHAQHRSAFGKLLMDQALMQNVLADLCMESEGATLVMLRLARAFDSRSHSASEHGLARLATAVAKYWICKRAPALVSEALECLGGNGYVEESILPRLYREAPLNSIWEGSGNIICLDVLRAIAREPAAVNSLMDELSAVRGFDRRFDQALAVMQSRLRGAIEERDARTVTEQLAILLGASLMIRHSTPEAADAFCATRLGGDSGHSFGTLPAGVEAHKIIQRAFPSRQH